MILVTALFSVLVSVFAATSAQAADLKIDRAFTDTAGGTIVVFRADTSLGSNTTFYCRDNRCDQLQQTTTMNLGSAFGAGFTNSEGASGSLLAEPTKGEYTLTCGAGGVTKLKPLPQPRVFDLEGSLRRGSLAIQMLPKSEDAAAARTKPADAPRSPCEPAKAATESPAAALKTRPAAK